MGKEQAESERPRMRKYFKVLEDHHEATAELHRRLSPFCIAPSIVWHIALWPEPEPASGSSAETQTEHKEEWLKSINVSLGALETLITGREEPEALVFRQDDTTKRFNDSLYLFQPGDRFSWQVKVESHYEFLTITVILSCRRPAGKWVKAKDDANWPAWLAQYLRASDLEDACTTLRSLIRKVEPDAPTDIKVAELNPTEIGDLREKADLLYNRIWERLAQGVFKCAGEFPGFIFADFRGLILGPLDDGSRKKGDHPENPGRREKCRNTLEQCEPLIRAINPEHDDREYVGCSMIDRRFVYCSTLAARPSLEPLDRSEAQPVRYTIVCTAPPKRYQTGRLVERIHVLGVTRLAALKGFRAIKEAGKEIQMLGVKLDERADSDLTLDEAKEFVSTLNQIGTTGHKEHDQSLPLPSDGVTYRIARSVYYTRLIKARLKELRIERVEGWQPYDEFLQRRLFPTLGFIEDVGKRLQAVRARMDSIVWLVDIEKSHNLNNKLLWLSIAAAALTAVSVLGAIEAGHALHSRYFPDPVTK